MKGYNGWSSWNEWNVVLWLSNDYDIEQQVRFWTDKGYSETRIIKALEKDLLGRKTPDGAAFNKKSIRSYMKNWSY